MFKCWSLETILYSLVLCGQSVQGFWPLSVLAEAKAPDLTYPDAGVKRIAIIGAGAAGSSTAYHLKQYASTASIPLNITVFERSSYIGGRSTTVNAYDNPLEPVELGASIFVDVNAILKNATAKFGLRPRASGSDEQEILGIWNGKEFVYTQKDGGWKYWDIAKLLWKYGLSPIRTQSLMKKTVGQFLKLYEPPFFPFRSLSDRAIDLGLTEVTAATGAQLLAENKIYPPFTTDIIQASTRVNYGQNLHSIHGLETMVCMAIEGAMQIEGGNWQIFASMLKSSAATVLLNTTVTDISKKDSKYLVKSSTLDPVSNEAHTNEEPYDTIILAAPLQYSDISINDGLLKYTPDVIPYVRLHVTLFTSLQTLNPIFFNLSPSAEVPTTILTTLPADELPSNPKEGCGTPGFFSISTLRTVINPRTMEREKLYKIFSPHELGSGFLADLLLPMDSNNNATISWFHHHAWNSYPYEFPRITFEETELARGFYYTSGMESFISTMETSALMGMNVARLVVDEYEGVEVGEGESGRSDSGQKLLKEDGGRIGGEEL